MAEPTITGTAVVKHKNTGKTYTISPSDLHIEEVSADERQMGAEKQYEATVSHEDLGDLTWNISEYPDGSLNDTDHQLNGHTLEQDFDFSVAEQP